MKEKCKICRTESEVRDVQSSFNKKIECPKCGSYYMDRSLYDDFEGYRISEIDKAKISSILKSNLLLHPHNSIVITNNLDKKEAGLVYIKIESLIESFPNQFVERADMALLNMEKLTTYAGERINLEEKDSNILMLDSFSPESEQYMYNFLKQKGYVSDVGSTFGVISLIIAPDGWSRLGELRTKLISPENNVFVAMWFNPEMETIYQKAIGPAIDECGYKAIKINNVEHNNKIDDEIIAAINRSKFIICDFTGHRGGVYYEAGYAKGLGLPVIWMCKKTAIDELHFDTRQFNHIVWESEEDLKVKLINRIRATILE